MSKTPINRGETGLIHPITGSYILIDDDGNIRIGTEMFGDAMFIKGNTGEVYIDSNRLHLICDEVEWNNLVLNKAAVNPTQAAFKKKNSSILTEELGKYGS